jgi:mannose/fructose/N-acetylgalactosamine-specific phosphotransferase system component IIC
MIRQFLASTTLFDLPLIAMGIFGTIFATVLVRAFQKSRAAEHRRMSLLPLQDDVERIDLQRSNAS